MPLMPKLQYHCTYVIDLSPIPNHAEYVFFDADRWDACIADLVAAVATDRDDLPLGERLSDTLATFVDRFYKCPNCGRLIVFWDGSDAGQSFTADRPL
jgi:hypothetical protein